MKQKHLENRTPVGVIGIGDLGTRLVAQLLRAGCEVLAFDSIKTSLNIGLLDKAVDPGLNVAKVTGKLVHQATVDDIVRNCELVHWAVPSSELVKLSEIPSSCTVILHDSVMANSAEALRLRPDKNRFVAAHCLMNDAQRVLIATQFGDTVAAISHFEKIGLCPKTITVKAHDSLMARTQGVFALLIKLGIRDELDKGFIAGDLTPSAIELRSAIMNREANWTTQTLQSILSNPELGTFVDEMASIITERDYSNIIFRGHARLNSGCLDMPLANGKIKP